ncbi:MAG: hypothetical protein LUE20_06390 [Oscillospiraceae bacterium]|nr:hypothetical protein [Oscillospiraceae bacterium]
MDANDIFYALNDIKDEYIFHAMNVNRRRAITMRRMLIAAVVVILTVVCAFTVYSANREVDRQEQDPLEPVRESLSHLADADYTLDLEVIEVEMDPFKKSKVLDTWRTTVKERGWNPSTFYVISGEYYIEYDNALTDARSGHYIVWYFLEEDDSGAWVIYDTMISYYSAVYDGAETES